MSESVSSVLTAGEMKNTVPGSPVTEKPIIIGIYGIPGCGKTHLINELKKHLDESQVMYFEGSEVISSIVSGGLEAFKNMEDNEKYHWRERAIREIARKCKTSGRLGIVTGHFMFWEKTFSPDYVYTEEDLKVFTHIVYLDVSPLVTAQQRENDSLRQRPALSVEHLEKWQSEEKKELERICRQRGILFARAGAHVGLGSILKLLRDFFQHTEAYNVSKALRKLDDIVLDGSRKLETFLVLDADRTLAAEDTGALFWETAAERKRKGKAPKPLKEIFGSELGYSYTAFRQATLYYEETYSDVEFEARCAKVADKVKLHAEFVTLLQRVKDEEHVGAVVVTSGLGLVWQNVLTKHNLFDKLKVIGGGRIRDGLVVTPEVKSAVVTHLQSTYGVKVWAFGDSPLDLKMLIAANEAIVVVGEKECRSTTMDSKLLEAIDEGGLRARQALLPLSASPRLDTIKLPVVDLTSTALLKVIFTDRLEGTRVIHATGTSASKLLATPMRNASLSGASLREAHRQAGWYLATRFVGDMIGIEEYSTPHVQGGTRAGYRLRDEPKTTIVAMMRGGEPMALGISEAFPLAMFVHAKNPSDVKIDHLQGQQTLILVDSVINKGKSMLEFLPYIRQREPRIRIVIVAGVVQAKALSHGELAELLAHDSNLGLVALRTSDNEYTGIGSTDTGHRLFNTTHMP